MDTIPTIRIKIHFHARRALKNIHEELGDTFEIARQIVCYNLESISYNILFWSLI